MRGGVFWVIVVALFLLAVATLFFGYWPLGIGLAIVVFFLLLWRVMGPRQSGST